MGWHARGQPILSKEGISDPERGTIVPMAMSYNPNIPPTHHLPERKHRKTMRTPTRMAKSSNVRATATNPFDAEGVRLAILAALEAVYESYPHITFPQYLIALEVRKAEREGEPHTLASLVKKLRMPFSTVSRVVWSLTEDGGDIGVIRYVKHPTDRRKKQLAINQNKLSGDVPAAVARAMVGYYGKTVEQLRRVAS